MENYNVQKKLGKGAQGSVFLVEDKLTHDLCVMKKVECSDQTEANKAFKEAVALQNLKHPYICGYREFFVIWEPEEAAIYVCIVMDYYKLGDLEQTLRKKRSMKEMLEEAVLRKWVRQMVEALVYVHGKNIIHRDLKPSNIFLKDDLSITIGDFGVATVMGSVRTITRTAVGSMSWMAPEVLELTPHYDERSDVWSLGCIVLEMATCAFKDRREMVPLLFELKNNPQVLEDVLPPVEERYGPELCQFIRMTLRRGYQQRPSSMELTELPFIQKCLGLSYSDLHKGLVADGGGSGVKPVPTLEGVGAVIGYMKENASSEICQIMALKHLLTVESLSVDPAGKRQLIQTMAEFKKSQDIQTFCCQILAIVVGMAELEEGDVLFKEDSIKLICMAMRSYAGSKDLFTATSSLLMVLSTDESAAAVIGKLGGIQDILSAMRSFSADLEIISNCCTALWSLSVVANNLAIITKEKGVMDVYNAMITHGDSQDLIDAACSALWSLSIEDDNLAIMANLEMTECLLQIIEKFMGDCGIVKFACSVLCSIIEVNELSAFHVLETKTGLCGVPIILKTLEVYSSNEEVIENIASVFDSLSSYDDIREELLSLKIPAVLTDLREKFSADKGPDASAAITKALEALNLIKKPPSPKPPQKVFVL